MGFKEGINNFKKKVKEARQREVRDNGRPLRNAADYLSDVRDGIQYIDMDDAKSIGETVVKGAGNTVKFSGMTTLWLLEYLVRTFNALLVDNPALRWGEEKYSEMPIMDKNFKERNSKGKPKKAKIARKTGRLVGAKATKFLHDHPTIASYITYWMIFAATIFGGVKGWQHIRGGKKTDKIEVTKPNDIDDVDKNVAGTYGAFLKRMEPVGHMLLPYLILPEDVHLSEDGKMHVPYNDNKKHPEKGKITIGFGSTTDLDGKPVTMDTSPITDQQACEKVYSHLKRETFLTMYIYSVLYPEFKFDEENVAMFIATCVSNTGPNILDNTEGCATKVKNLYNTYGENLTDQDILDYYAKKPVKSLTDFGKELMSGKSVLECGGELSRWVYQGGEIANGLYVRRFSDIGLGLGKITARASLDYSPGLIYGYGKNVGYNKNNAFFIGREVNLDTYAELVSYLKKNSKGKKHIRDFVPQEVVKNIEAGTYSAEYKERTKKYNEARVFIVTAEQKKAVALSAFKQGDYSRAASFYKDLCAEYPDDVGYRNDLALTYIKQEKYEDAINELNYIVSHVDDITQLSPAYYNMGLAYEKKGDLEKALEYYGMAKDAGNKSAQSAIDEINNGNKLTSFERGRKNIKQNAFMKGLVAFQEQNNKV